MNKIKKVLTFISVFFSIITVSTFADQIEVNINEEEYYYKRQVNGAYTTGKWSTYEADGKVLYCISPYVNTISTYTTGDFSKSNLSNSVKKKILLIAYYGYDYENHHTLKYKAATQALIWEEILGSNSKVDFYKDEALKDSYLDIASEKSEINNLIERHYLKPSFDDKTYNININNSFQLVDTNNVLSKYNIINDSNLEAVIENNILTVNSSKLNSYNLKLEKYDYADYDYKIYYGTDSKSFISSGSFEKVISNVGLITTGGTLTIDILDFKTNSKEVTGSGTLKNATYGIYNNKDILIEEIKTDINGKAVSDIINNFGTYYVKEINSSVGYSFDNTKYYFELNEENRNIKLQIKSKVIENTITIRKTYSDLNTSNSSKFAIYDSNNNLYKELSTDSRGVVSLNLPYGKYRVSQLTETEKYVKAKDINIDVNVENENVDLVFEDTLIKFYLNIITTDNTSNAINQKGITYKIFDIDNNKYICENTICEFLTDENGQYTTNFMLQAGNYRIEEVSKYTIGYALNDKPLIFKISSLNDLNKDKYTVKFQKQKVLGTLSIYKYGEELIIENGTFKYNKIPLKNVTYEIWDDNHCIREIATDKNGSITLYGMQLKKYYIIEKHISSDYKIDKSRYEVDLNYVDQYTKTVSKSVILNATLRKGNIEYTKIDVRDNQGIANVLIEVYTENDELLYTERTDESGNLKINDLKIGTYYILEKEVPKDYVKNNEKIYVEVTDIENVKIKTTNELILTDVPSTGVYKFPLIQISSLLVFFVSLFYEKKN